MTAAATGETLGRIGRARQWWMGDWLNYGERAYGEKYAQAIEATGYEYSTLNSFRWVAGEIESVRRRTSLDWSHHREVAARDPPEAKVAPKLLQLAGGDKLKGRS